MGEAAILERDTDYQAAIAACVAERLKTLGHPAGMLTPGALEALVAHAGGSIPRLRAALTSAIFLAATEDSPRIDRDHVARAVDQTGPPAALRAAPVHRFGGLASPRGRGAFLAAACGCAAIVIALMTLGHFPRLGRADSPAIRAAAANVVPPPSPLPAVRPTPLPPSDSRTEAARPPAPAPPALPPLAPAVAIGDPPLPPLAHAKNSGGIARTIAPVLPSGPTTIVLRYRRGDRWANDKLNAATLRLRQAGYTRIFAKVWQGPNPPAPVTYFYNQDHDAAQAVDRVVAVASLLGGPAWWRTKAPELAPGPAGLDRHKPGTIETLLP